MDNHILGCDQGFSGSITYLKTVRYSIPEANSDSVESHIVSSSPSGVGTTATN